MITTINDEYPMVLDLADDSGATVAGITEFAQRSYRGDHFCTLTPQLVGYSFLYFELCEFRPPLLDDEISRKIPLLGVPGESPCVLEHFLQSVRKNFSGESYDLIRVVSTWNYQHLWVPR